MRCDKSPAMNIVRCTALRLASRVLLPTLSLVALWGCSGGGSAASTPATSWEKFRHDINNTGQGTGTVATNNHSINSVLVDAGTPSPISSSPAIALDGTVYVGSEGGTLAAFDARLGVRWRATSCDACPAGQQSLGPLISSPAVYTFGTQTSVLIGSQAGALFVFTDSGTNQPTCTVCFRPGATDSTIESASFVSSPTFTTNVVTGSIAGVFIGARVNETHGKLYAVNNDGTLRWQFPRLGNPDIGAVTSSPALGAGNALYFTADDGNLYAVGTDGTFKWQFSIGTVSDPTAPFAASPVTSTLIYAATTGGNILAINPDSSFRWQVASPDGAGFVASLAVGNPAPTTPTSTATAAATPTPQLGGPTTTPTGTPTPIPSTETIFGVTKTGIPVFIQTATGTITAVTGQFPTISAPVVSSPALSGDAYLIFGAGDGKLHAVHTGTGEELSSDWPVTLADGVLIRSSPAVGSDGTIYVGADNGRLYAVGLP
jgi:outer membrane protein assembly factor BamB